MDGRRRIYSRQGVMCMAFRLRRAARRLRSPPEGRRRLLACLCLFTLLLVLLRANAYWKRLAGDMALSDASDLVTMTVNDTVRQKLAGGDYGYDYFVTLEKDNNGNIAAITSDMARINAFSTEVLSDVVRVSEVGALDIRIPIGTLLGTNLTLGRGPAIPVRVTMLTSSRAGFRNELVSSGINQTKHQMILEVTVDIDIVIPWKTLSTQVVCQTLIAETVIVGQVPETYMNLE